MQLLLLPLKVALEELATCGSKQGFSVIKFAQDVNVSDNRTFARPESSPFCLQV